MKYYIIDNDLNSKIIGSEYPQSWQFTKEYEKRKNNSNSIYALDEFIYEKKIHPNFVPDLDGFVLSGRAKQTNFISVVCAFGLFMDERAKDILQSKCNLGDHDFYEATLYVRKEPKRYYYLGLFYNIIPLIEFNKCHYVIYGIKDEKDLPEEWLFKPIESFSDLYQIEKKYQNYPNTVSIKCNKIIFKDTFNLNVDVFYANRFSKYRNGICTERFKNAVEEAGLTGLVFEPIEVEIDE